MLLTYLDTLQKAAFLRFLGPSGSGQMRWIRGADRRAPAVLLLTFTVQKTQGLRSAVKPRLPTCVSRDCAETDRCLQPWADGWQVEEMEQGYAGRACTHVRCSPQIPVLETAWCRRVSRSDPNPTGCSSPAVAALGRHGGETCSQGSWKQDATLPTPRRRAHP